MRAPLRAAVRAALVMSAWSVFLVVAAPARAEERYAVVIGNNRGEGEEAVLRYAESDARKMGELLRELGNVPSANVVVTTGQDATTVRNTIIRVNERIRQGRPAESTLIVFYSGHADAESLHLAGSRLGVGEIESLVSGSSAAFRLLMVDACRSGALTRVKGGQPAVPIAVRLDQRTPSEGAVFLAASSANEDAQESDAIRGSFFTHYLVSGLRGAADDNHDGAVDLDEAYAYAYANTIRASSQTLAGLQHPTYRHDIKGQGRVVLTRWRQGTSNAYIDLPSGQTWVVFRGSAAGDVVAEVGKNEGARTIAVAPGAYFLRGRTRDALLEGTLLATAGRRAQVREGDFTRIDYARLVRKGGADAPDAVHGLQLGYRVRSSLEAGGDLCQGIFGGYVLDFESVTFMARVGLCVAGFQNSAVRTDSREVDAELRIHHAFDLPWLTVEVGAGLGVAWLHQSFETRALAPDRDAVAPHGDATLALSRDLWGGLYVLAEGAGMLYLVRNESGDGQSLEPLFSVRVGAGLGARF